MSTAPRLAIEKPRQIALLVGFIILVLLVASVIGILAAPDVWYDTLQKPPFNPPNWVFGPVWTILYVLIGISGWRVFVTAPKSTAMWLWWAQLPINWIWTPVFFRAHLLWPALAVILVMIALIVAFIRASWRLEKVSAWLFVPYLAWVCFAAILNASLAVLN